MNPQLEKMFAECTNLLVQLDSLRDQANTALVPYLAQDPDSRFHKRSLILKEHLEYAVEEVDAVRRNLETLTGRDSTEHPHVKAKRERIEAEAKALAEAQKQNGEAG